ncbi:MAG TPA: UDP-N-acetylmuramoyl-L-alanine--D-glutamate ligase, partial [Burkholderiaceae bacterium]|nr:UDP-N-acetylmuramoyl-L-alanine--D-glutamate ligase [Burkholderiaceae bacterium]
MNELALPPLSGQHVLVLGLGESGLAMARWCVRAGASVSVWDSRQSPPQLAALREQVPAAELRSGALDAVALHGVQLLLKS